MKTKRASADTQNVHRQRLLVCFPGIQTSAEIDTYFRAKEETAQEYNHLGWSIFVALGLAITGFFDP